jgi:hypothetical protein
MPNKRKNIDLNLITSLREMGLSWTQIQQHPDVDVSKSKMSCWRVEINFVEPRQRISDNQLDAQVANLIEGQPRRGEDTIGSAVAVLGFQVPRQQLRDSIHRVDPEGVLERSHKAIKRVVYRSQGPHHDWHMDGNHKLIRWGIVIHGCVDGCSRNIIYLVARDSNKAAVVLEAFVDGMDRYQLPMHVSGDKGGENVRVAEYMIHRRGVGTKAFKPVSSTRNTRIERLWRDMRENRVQMYIDLFTGFEDAGMDLNNLLDIFTLQYLFLPRINADLQQFIAMWNNHKLSTESNHTPVQILNYFRINDTADPGQFVDEFSANEEDEFAAPLLEAIELQRVECNPRECPLSVEQMIEFRERVEPLTLAVPFSDLEDMYGQGINVIHDIYYRV